MLGPLDTFLDSITMYRLVLYELIILVVAAAVLGIFGFVPYSPFAIGISAVLFTIIAYITNKVFAYVFEVPANVESVYITALILTLIAKPIHSYHDLPFIGWLAVWAIASKYIFAIKKKHIFNPVAIAAVICSVFLGQSVNWWVGTAWMAPIVTILGFTIVRKIQREDFIYSFFLIALVMIGMFTMLKNGDIVSAMQTTILNSSLLFFGFVMLTEPLTTPPTKNLQILYGILVGFLFAPQIHVGNIFSTPELALVVGNIFSYLVSPKQKLMLHLKEKIQIGLDQMDFIFQSPEKLSFRAGQYMEWTLQHPHTDSRGNRRYFTIASSPTEQEIHLGIKFYPQGSSYKNALAKFSANQTIVAGQLAGDFTLPKDKNKKLVFIAGGIGITPFRSMAKYIIDAQEKRDIVLLYSNKLASEIMYGDIFTKAISFGVRSLYTLTDIDHIPANWTGERGRITAEMIQKNIPDFKERTFYLSGPHAMVSSFEAVLLAIGMPTARIKKDFFPGFV